MAPRDTTKPTSKAVSATKSNISRSSPAKTKKTIAKNTDKKALKMSNTTSTRQRTASVPKVGTVSTPKPKENKPIQPPSSVTKSGKKSWQRRPKPAHSGVPVPEKMKRLLEKQFIADFDCSF